MDRDMTSANDRYRHIETDGDQSMMFMRDCQNLSDNITEEKSAEKSSLVTTLDTEHSIDTIDIPEDNINVECSGNTGDNSIFPCEISQSEFLENETCSIKSQLFERRGIILSPGPSEIYSDMLATGYTLVGARKEELDTNTHCIQGHPDHEHVGKTGRLAQAPPHQLNTRGRDIRLERVRVAFNDLHMGGSSMQQLEPFGAYEQDRDGDTCLHIAVILQDAEVAMKLIAMAPDPRMLDVSNYLLQTPLYLAVLTNQLVVVRSLIAGGVSLQTRDREGNTPLHIACRKGYYDITKSLLTPLDGHGPYCNGNVIHGECISIENYLELKNYHGETALHLAGIHFREDILHILTSKGANINAIFSKTGNTILHEAALSGNLPLNEFLLKYRTCDINARAFNGSTPFDVARAHCRWEIARLLAAAGAILCYETDT